MASRNMAVMGMNPNQGNIAGNQQNLMPGAIGPNGVPLGLNPGIHNQNLLSYMAY